MNNPYKDCGLIRNYKLLLLHLKERPYKCEYCEKAFCLLRTLRVHENSVHLKQRPYACEHCDTSFSEKGSLRRHLRTIHLTQRPYTCELCGKSFSQNYNMRKHLISIHSNVRHSASNDSTVAQMKLRQKRQV
ncbi:unnamed protein product [Dicrocoelium dendriticum]|nr:unnamed protein product [Dicrocoelium dendriticum]